MAQNPPRCAPHAPDTSCVEALLIMQPLLTEQIPPLRDRKLSRHRRGIVHTVRGLVSSIQFQGLRPMGDVGSGAFWPNEASRTGVAQIYGILADATSVPLAQ